MKYVIIGYTSDIDIKTNSAKIRYLKATPALNEINFSLHWVNNVNEATTFTYRENADNFIADLMFKDIKVISYGIEE